MSLHDRFISHFENQAKAIEENWAPEYEGRLGDLVRLAADSVRHAASLLRMVEALAPTDSGRLDRLIESLPAVTDSERCKCGGWPLDPDLGVVIGHPEHTRTQCKNRFCDKCGLIVRYVDSDCAGLHMPPTRQVQQPLCGKSVYGPRSLYRDKCLLAPNHKGLCRDCRGQAIDSSEVRFVAKHIESELWIVERRGSLARWGERSAAITMTRPEWNEALEGRSLVSIVLEVAEESP